MLIIFHLKHGRNGCKLLRGGGGGGGQYVLLHKYQCHTLLLLCFNGNKRRVLIRDARGVNARILLTFATRHHAKHMLNNE